MNELTGKKIFLIHEKHFSIDEFELVIERDKEGIIQRHLKFDRYLVRFTLMSGISMQCVLLQSEFNILRAKIHFINNDQKNI